MFYIQDTNNNIIAFNEDKQIVKNLLHHLGGGYTESDILETTRPIVDFKFTDTEEYQTEVNQKEAERKALLSLTKADVLLALYQDKGITPEQIKTMLADNVPALIKFDYASNYYRGDDVVIALGQQLGYTPEQVDYLFEHKTFPTTETTE